MYTFSDPPKEKSTGTVLGRARLHVHSFMFWKFPNVVQNCHSGLNTNIQLKGPIYVANIFDMLTITNIPDHYSVYITTQLELCESHYL